MAIDGIFLSKLRCELKETVIGLRVDKVNQPTKDEIVLSLRGKGCAYSLLCCVRADSPRVHLTAHKIGNPPAPPMFCMLLRKYLTGAMIKDIRQQGMDRILFIDFDATNEIGDRIELTVCMEIMGKHSNFILMSEGKVVDSIKRIDFATSSVRQILPGVEYKLPPQQDKMNIENESAEKITEKILSFDSKLLSTAIMNTLEGVSPIIAREIAHRVSFGDEAVKDLSSIEINSLRAEIGKIKNELQKKDEFFVLLTAEGKPKDLSYIDIKQYDDTFKVKKYDSASELLDDFYFERDRINRINHRGHELIKLMTNLVERTARKLQIQREELKKCADREQLKLYGELIVANLYQLQKGTSFYEVQNYYDNCNLIKIPCDPALSPTENQKKYYKEYRKAQTAEQMLTKLIADGENELTYLESVLDEISRADTDSEISAIRMELSDAGYIKNIKGKKQKQPKELPPLEFRTSDGFRVLVGRNNVQNDKLSLKVASKSDMWLHTQKIPGSHVIIFGDGREISDEAIEEAAVIAAYHSKARESSLVPVDYTRVRALKKPNGAKAGMVIYHEYYSIIVNPDKEAVEKMKV
ncbi:MAG: NFACT family protein [Clostridia bacterium]|nr:NFACT family protein [Clostridia bacterium]